MITSADIVNMIAGDVADFESMATEFAKTRFLALSVEFNENEKEAQEIMKIADHVKCVIAQDGEAFSLKINFDEGTGNYFEIMNEGMPAPLSGGDGGIAMNPDGSTYRSQVPPELWGTRLDELAEDGIDIVGEIKTMLTDLFKEHIRNAVSQYKSKIAERIKTDVIKELQSIQR